VDDHGVWTDGVLSERFRGIDRELELMGETHQALAAMPHELAQSLVRTEDRLSGEIRERDDRLREEIAARDSRLSAAIAAVAKTCSDFQREYREDRKEWRTQNSARAVSRTQAAAALVVGALGLIGGVLAALISSGAL
jgi:metal-dependent amidase/aminoacylase/carboxypeptidase family protein